MFVLDYCFFMDFLSRRFFARASRWHQFSFILGTMRLGKDGAGRSKTEEEVTDAAGR